MKRLLAAALLTVILFSLGGSAPRSLYRLVGVNAKALYQTLIRSLDSACVTKVAYSTENLYALLSSPRVEVVYKREEGLYGARKVKLQYRSSLALIPFYRPPYTYYDGEHYFYQHDGDWFIDAYNHFSYRLTPDLLTASSSVFDGCAVEENQVYADWDRWILHLRTVGEGDNAGVTHQVVIYVSPQLEVEQIRITSHYDREGKSYSTYTTIRYRDIGRIQQIDPPKNLSEEEQAFLIQELAQRKLQENMGDQAPQPLEESSSSSSEEAFPPEQSSVSQSSGPDSSEESADSGPLKSPVSRDGEETGETASSEGEQAD